MSIAINLPAYLRPYANDNESIAVKGKTIQECLNDLIKKYPGLKKMVFDQDGQLHTYVSIFAANEIVYADQLEKTVKDGDTIHILYIIGGG
ncbi:MAG TPA: MoaD/ThiS family protein [Dehalococcoidales bacterium]